jgi:hypothetical protein
MVSYVVAGWAIGLSIMLSRAFNLVCPSLHFLPMISCSSGNQTNKQKVFFFFFFKYIRRRREKKKKYNYIRKKKKKKKTQPDGNFA